MIRRDSVASGINCRMRRKRLIRPTFGNGCRPDRRDSDASGIDCRMRRKRLIRPTFGNGCRPDKTRQRRI
ncbi:ribonucleoside diphosphage reductase 1, beta subunit, B2, partial [Escherichia coli TA249]